MNDLLDTELGADEIRALPDRLRWRYWAGETGQDVPALTPLKSVAVRHECRNWLAWRRNLKVGDSIRYVGLATGLQGKPGRVVRRDAESVSITIRGFRDTFSVDPRDLVAGE